MYNANQLNNEELSAWILNETVIVIELELCVECKKFEELLVVALYYDKISRFH